MTPTSHALENQLLLCCARTQLNEPARSQVKQLVAKELDWTYLLQTASFHGVGPLLYRSLQAVVQDAIPPPAQSWLRGHTQHVFVRSSLLARELLNVLAAFEVHKLPAIPYKGPVLAACAYGGLALRPFGDLDIWVHRNDMVRGKEILFSLGHQAGQPDKVRDEETYLRTHHDYLFVKQTKDQTTHLELQWGVTETSFPFPVEFQPLWERRNTVPLLGRAIPNLSVEDALLILCVHGAKHGWDRLMWVCDIAELLRANSAIDWTWLNQHAKKLGGRRMLLLGLHLAHSLLDAQLPERVTQQIQADSVIGAFARRVGEKLLRGAPASAARVRDERPFQYLKLRERWQDKLQLIVRYSPGYFFRIVTPNELDHACCSLPRSLAVLYYLVRPLRLIGAYARRTWESSNK